MDYKIVSAGYPDGLTKKVKELLEEGWKPVGDIVLLKNINKIVIVECYLWTRLLK